MAFKLPPFLAHRAHDSKTFDEIWIFSTKYSAGLLRYERRRDALRDGDAWLTRFAIDAAALQNFFCTERPISGVDGVPAIKNERIAPSDSRMKVALALPATPLITLHAGEAPTRAAFGRSSHAMRMPDVFVIGVPRRAHGPDGRCAMKVWLRGRASA